MEARGRLISEPMGLDEVSAGGDGAVRGAKSGSMPCTGRGSAASCARTESTGPAQPRRSSRVARASSSCLNLWSTCWPAVQEAVVGMHAALAFAVGLHPQWGVGCCNGPQLGEAQKIAIPSAFTTREDNSWRGGIHGESGGGAR